jgi:SagB-type dehydrogenase family enzyme
MEAATAEGARRDLLQANSFYHHQLHQYAPQFIDALARLGDAGDFGRALVLGRLARCFQLAGRSELSVSRLHEAVAVARRFTTDDCALALQGMLQTELGDALRAAEQYSEAKKAYEEALHVAESLRDLRGQGISLSQLGSLALAEGRPEEALSRHRTALALLQKVSELGAEAIAWHQLGIVFHRLGQWDEAERHYREAARLRESAGDRSGAAQLWNQFAQLCREAGRLEPADSWYQKATGAESQTDALILDDPSPALEITVHEQLSTEYALEPDLLIDGPREHRAWRWTKQLEFLAEDLRPMLVPCSRTYADGDSSIRVALPQGEPCAERQPGCTVMRRLRRELAISGDPDLIWRLIQKMDGFSTVADILVRLPTNKRNAAARLLAILAASGAIDVSGRPIGRFLHSTTKKGALPAGGLQSDQVYNIATDSDYRTYPEALRVPLHESVPEALRSFHTLTRARRSRRNYSPLALQRKEFEALLCTACGVTGATSWAGRELKLRAYPSSGALYAVEVYPLVFHVDGLDPAVYHYHVVDNVLEVVQPSIDKDAIIGAMLPMERQMVSGAATMICLTGNFPRHERKYGEGGYRMLIAEAGHVSQNLVLAATALGLAARPFGGVFDGLINRDIGLDETKEEFLLSVLIGHTDGGGQSTVVR